MCVNSVGKTAVRLRRHRSKRRLQKRSDPDWRIVADERNLRGGNWFYERPWERKTERKVGDGGDNTRRRVPSGYKARRSQARPNVQSLDLG